MSVILPNFSPSKYSSKAWLVNISTSVWVPPTPNNDQNLLFPCFMCVLAVWMQKWRKMRQKDCFGKIHFNTIHAYTSFLGCLTSIFWLTSVWEYAPKNLFATFIFASKSFKIIWKALEKEILISVWSVQHPNTGQTIQHLVDVLCSNSN